MAEISRVTPGLHLRRCLPLCAAPRPRPLTELAGLLSVKDERLRRQVCNDILDRAMKVRELQDFENRLLALEKAMEDKGRRRYS